MDFLGAGGLYGGGVVSIRKERSCLETVWVDGEPFGGTGMMMERRLISLRAR